MTEPTTPTLHTEIKRLHDLRLHIEELKRVEKLIEADILSQSRDIIAAQLADAPYGAGTATLDVEGFKAKVVVSKKVTYDQEGLAAVRKTLTANGEDPSEYVKVKYDVAEAAYKNWPTSLQKMFEPYRTVEASKPTIKIEV
jgi:hypothetical protein